MDLRKLNKRRRVSSKVHASHNADAPGTNIEARQTATSPTTSKRKRLLTKKTIIPTTIVVVLLIAWISVQISTPQPSTESTVNIKVPQYQTVLPNNKSIAELGGWKRLQPPESDPVFAYNDTISGVAINVIQQPIPKSFKGHVADRVAELAKGYNATTKLDADTTTVYVGISVKGPQSVIFTKKNLLVLIKSQKKIENQAWMDYVKSLIIQNETLPKF